MRYITVLLMAWLLATEDAAYGAGAMPASAQPACRGEASFHLAYLHRRDDAEPVDFPNDELFRYMSTAPYIYAADLLHAEVVRSESGYGVNLTLSPAGMASLNALVEQNLKAQHTGDFDAVAGLGLVVNGRPRAVIQGMLHPVSGNVVHWASSPGKTAAEAEEVAAAVNCKDEE